MKRYVVTFILNKTRDKVLLIKRIKPPYIGKYNGIGGKIEGNETIHECCIRETFEEIGIKIDKPIHLVTHIYPETIGFNNKNVELNVFYDILDEVPIKDIEEGSFHWMDVDFVENFENKELAGYANTSLFIREILEVENVKHFYN